MGCGTSSTATGSTEIPGVSTISYSNGNMKTSESILAAYQRLDEDIIALESTCPGPRLATAEAWIDHLDEIVNQSNSNTMTAVEAFAEVKLDKQSINDKEKNDVTKVRRVALQLGVALDIGRAMQQEEFLARINNTAMEIKAEQLHDEMVEHARKRANELLEKYNKLKSLYMEQDGLLTSVTGGTYTSVLEQKLDEQLDTARQIRDKLGAVAEQWRTSGCLLRACAKSAAKAFEYWSLIGPSRNADERISLAIDCRDILQGSLVAFEGAQTALPQVEIPYVSPRHVSAVRHANIYLLTDMANEARFGHTKDVFEAFQNNTSKAVDWLHDTYKKTLMKDLSDAEDAVRLIAKKLRQERIRFMMNTIGTKIYLPPSYT